MSDYIVKTDAVVLKRMDYLESSRIVTLFTREHGKVAVLAKGARSRNNRFGSSLEPGVIATVVYYTKPNRELQTLTQADTVERFRAISSSMARLTGALHLLDVAHAITDVGHSLPEFYEVLISALKAVNSTEEGLSAVLLGYRLKVSHVSGLAPRLSTCVKCGGTIDDREQSRHTLFDIQRGGVVCHSCEKVLGEDHYASADQWGGRIRLKSDRVAVLRQLLDEDFDNYPAGLVTRGMWNELDGLMRLYERHHVLHGRTLKTESMIREFIV